MTDTNVNSVGLSGSTSFNLLKGVKENDQAAWTRLVTLYSPLVYHWIRQVGLQQADAADVGQEVFVAVARSIRDFQRGQMSGSFRAWLRVITRNKVRDAFRRNRGEVLARGGTAPEATLQALDEECAAEPSTQEELSLLYQRVVALIQQEFEPKTWEAFWQVVAEENTPAEVARNLGMSVNSVYLAKSRIIRRVRQEFCDLGEQDSL